MCSATSMCAVDESRDEQPASVHRATNDTPVALAGGSDECGHQRERHRQRESERAKLHVGSSCVVASSAATFFLPSADLFSS